MMMTGRELLRRAKEVQGAVSKLSGILSISNEINFDAAIEDNELKKVVGTLYKDGHYARAVEEGYKFLNNLVKKNSGLSQDGASLMRTALSVNSPIIKLNDGMTQSQKDEQQGYMDICAGCMTGIRNPRAHEHDMSDTKQGALQLLIMADHLVERIRKATS